MSRQEHEYVVGEKVMVINFGWSDIITPMRVVRVTKTQVVVASKPDDLKENGRRFNRESGKELNRAWSRDLLFPWDQERWDRVVQEQRKNRLVREVSKIEWDRLDSEVLERVLETCGTEKPSEE